MTRRLSPLPALAIVAALGLSAAACSERTQESAEADAEKAGDTVAREAGELGQSIESGAEKAGNAVENATRETGQEVRQGADAAGAEVRDEAGDAERAAENADR